jgi:SAM-dependent methyltransferase
MRVGRMPRVPTVDEHIRIARRYFSSFVADYHRAFEGGGRNPLHRVVNTLFRHKTFQRRLAIVRGFLEACGLEGKRVLDLGCGTGEVALVAARLGAAHVTGIDLVPEMVATARQQAADAGFLSRTEFRVGDVHSAPLPRVDVTVIVSVLEYYGEMEEVLARACAATRELLILVDTRGPFWRRALRRLLARLKGFRIYYRTPEEFSAAVARNGFEERTRVRGHSFWALAYRRTP